MDTVIRTKQILPIGDNTPVSKGWRYHAVAWRGSNTSSGTVYDACLKVIKSSAWVLPINMSFTEYEDLLAIASINLAGFNNSIHRLD
jgi:hypothetical protein